jgi:hypothetical protein
VALEPRPYMPAYHNIFRTKIHLSLSRPLTFQAHMLKCRLNVRPRQTGMGIRTLCNHCIDSLGSPKASTLPHHQLGPFLSALHAQGSEHHRLVCSSAAGAATLQACHTFLMFVVSAPAGMLLHWGCCQALRLCDWAGALCVAMPQLGLRKAAVRQADCSRPCSAAMHPTAPPPLLQN